MLINTKAERSKGGSSGTEPSEELGRTKAAGTEQTPPAGNLVQFL